jgi:hypothetical protein
MAKKGADFTPGLGTTEADARGPMRALITGARSNQFGKVFEEAARRIGGFNIISHVEDTSEALALLRATKGSGHPVNIILCGVSLSDANGFTLADANRVEHLADQVVFVGLPGFITERMRKRGVDDFVGFPSIDSGFDAEVTLKEAVYRISHPQPAPAA